MMSYRFEQTMRAAWNRLEPPKGKLPHIGSSQRQGIDARGKDAKELLDYIEEHAPIDAEATAKALGVYSTRVALIARDLEAQGRISIHQCAHGVIYTLPGGETPQAEAPATLREKRGLSTFTPRNYMGYDAVTAVSMPPKPEWETPQ